MSRRPNLSQAYEELFPVAKGEKSVAGLKLIEHAHIEIKAQPRTKFPKDDIAELARSISEVQARGEGIEGTGLWQPLVVKAQDNPAGVRYRLIAGERRFRASQQAGVPLVPAIVVPVREDGILLAQLIENLQRQGLPLLDEARSLQQLMDEQHLSYRDAAVVLGKSRSYIGDRIALLKMGADVQAMVSARADTLHHARVIDAVQDQRLRRALIEETLQGAPRRDIERRAGAGTDTVVGATESTPATGEEVSARADTHSGRESQTMNHGTTRPRTILAQLKSAVALAAEAARFAEENAKPTQQEARDIRQQIELLEQQIARLKARLGGRTGR